MISHLVQPQGELIPNTADSTAMVAVVAALAILQLLGGIRIASDIFSLDLVNAMKDAAALGDPLSHLSRMSKLKEFFV